MSSDGYYAMGLCVDFGKISNYRFAFQRIVDNILRIYLGGSLWCFDHQHCLSRLSPSCVDGDCKVSCRGRHADVMVMMEQQT